MAQAAHRPRARSPLPSAAASPAPPVSRTHPRSLAISLPGKRVPLVSTFLAPVTGLATRLPLVATAPSSRHLLARQPGCRLASMSSCASRAIPSPPCLSRPIDATMRHHPAVASSLVLTTSRPLAHLGRL
jgi:hypothetical protein